MPRWLCAIVLTLLTAALSSEWAYAAGPTKSAQDKHLEQIEAFYKSQVKRLKQYDPEAHARRAIAANDFRPVVFDAALGESRAPGITCSEFPAKRRSLFFSDVILPGSGAYFKAIERAATRFNRALIGHRLYPHKDVCFVSDKTLTPDEIATIAGRPERRPLIVDLNTAARAADLDAVRRMISAGADVNSGDDWNLTPLMWAMRRVNLPIVAELLQSGADPDGAPTDFPTPLIVAVTSGDAEILRTLLTAKPGTSFRNNNLAPALVATSKSIDLLRLLVEFRAVPSPDNLYNAWDLPLSRAARNKCAACLQLMLDFVDPPVRSSRTVQKIIEHDLDDEASPTLVVLARAALTSITYSEASQKSLAGAIDAGHPRIVKLLLTEGQDVNLLTQAEQAALVQAAGQGAQSDLRAILEIAAQRWKALEKAIKAHDPAKIRDALPAGISLAQDRAFTPLMLAARDGNAATVATLVALGSTVNAQTSIISRKPDLEGDTALSFALRSRNIDTTRALLANGADPELPSGDVPRPLLSGFGRELEKATSEQLLEFLDLFLRSATPERRQLRADEILRSVVSWSRFAKPLTDLIPEVVSRGGRPCAVPPDPDRPAIVEAAFNDSFHTFKFLVEHCPEWSAPSRFARASLRAAISLGYMITPEQLQIVRYLIELGTPLPEPEHGLTTLILAVGGRSVELVEIILSAGAPINEVLEGRTALDVAGDYLENDKVLEYLRGRGAKTAAELGIKQPEPPFPF